MHILTRQDALKLGADLYFTGKPCRRGHVSQRSTVKSECIECKKEYARERYLKNATKYKDAANERYRKNKEQILSKQADYYQRNKERILKSVKKYREENPEIMKIWRKKNKAALTQYSRDYKARNIKKVRTRRNKYEKRKKIEDPQYRATLTMRSMLHRVLQSKKEGRAEEILGYTRNDFKEKIESTFLEGMSWDNHGEWHIDHIIPISVMLKSGETDPAVINALGNLQAMWAIDNLRKGANIEHGDD